jgi:hypothetical protein
VVRPGDQGFQPQPAPPLLELTNSRRPPTGKQFLPVEEAELLPDLLTLATSLWRPGRKLIAIPEFVGQFGVPDLVVVVAHAERLELRLASGIPALTYEPDAAIVAALRSRRGASAESIAGGLGWELASVSQRLKHLTRIGAVMRNGRGELIRNPGLVVIGSLHALEAKVRDWRRGRDQARRYNLWASTSSVVLAHRSASTASIRRELSQWGVGLAIRSEWICRPRPFGHSPARRLLASELAVAALPVTNPLPSGSRSGPGGGALSTAAARPQEALPNEPLDRNRSQPARTSDEVGGLEPACSLRR